MTHCVLQREDAAALVAVSLNHVISWWVPGRFAHRLDVIRGGLTVAVFGTIVVDGRRCDSTFISIPRSRDDVFVHVHLFVHTYMQRSIAGPCRHMLFECGGGTAASHHDVREEVSECHALGCDACSDAPMSMQTDRPTPTACSDEPEQVCCPDAHKHVQNSQCCASCTDGAPPTSPPTACCDADAGHHVAEAGHHAAEADHSTGALRMRGGVSMESTDDEMDIDDGGGSALKWTMHLLLRV